jgi:hypothetical protein
MVVDSAVEFAEYLSIHDLSAFPSGGQRSVLGVLRMYLDGSGKSEDPSINYLTLGGLFATNSIWDRLQDRWLAALHKHGAPYSHMNEMVQGEGPFLNWGDDQKIALAKDLLMCLSFEDRMSLIGCSLTVDLTGYRELLERSHIKPAEAVCVDFCMTHMFAHEEFSKGKAEVIFDMNESFIRHLTYTWTRGKKDASSWAAYIASVLPGDMREVVPIQAADLLSWSVNRRYSSNSAEATFWRSLKDRTVLGLTHFHALYSKPELMQHPGFYDWLKHC